MPSAVSELDIAVPDTVPDDLATGPSFADFGLHPQVVEALAGIGYQTPTPIQAATIAPMLAGRDVLGLAQTGTGKTAAFALPILTRLAGERAGRCAPLALVLTPTRELAIQVAEAFGKYAAQLPGFSVLPIYGGAPYPPQLAGLRKGVHVVVGTPGRVMDHMERGSLDLSGLECLVLDEADEMLRMGFAEDVEKVMAATPPTRQVALFSATMPPAIRKIAAEHLNDPADIAIKSRTSTVTTTRQRFWMVNRMHKLDALTRILEVEPYDGMIVFVRTKQATEDLAAKLRTRGFAASAINGDMSQPVREQTIASLRDGRLDILVATDVAARGLDVDRISHVLNYDIPHDTESYVHRIGRTGRAGRSGEAILFVAQRERHMLRSIERTTRQPLEQMALPTVAEVNASRQAKFAKRITEVLRAEDLSAYEALIESYQAEQEVSPVRIAAALARMVHGDAPLLLAEDEEPAQAPRPDRPAAGDTETYRIAIGHTHRVKPGNIVGAITGETGLSGNQIGRIEIHADHSLVDLPAGLSPETLRRLGTARIGSRQLRISRGSHGPRRDARPTPTTRSSKDSRQKKPRHKKAH
ncbi:DEAD/DEAH box helicase [Fodinicola acaciae]|uniref:DEAD/DEAH box helicase n=1 Tax=Fodinicola acaciae TaxID=2681555 RepID=UPI0013D8C7A4